MITPCFKRQESHPQPRSSHSPHPPSPSITSTTIHPSILNSSEFTQTLLDLSSCSIIIAEMKAIERAVLRAAQRQIPHSYLDININGSKYSLARCAQPPYSHPSSDFCRTNLQGETKRELHKLGPLRGLREDTQWKDSTSRSGAVTTRIFTLLRGSDVGWAVDNQILPNV
jgi:hypothetical protein